MCFYGHVAIAEYRRKNSERYMGHGSLLEVMRS